MKKTIRTYVTVFLTAALLSGCGSALLIEGLTAEEIAIAGRSATMLSEYGMAIRGSSIVVAEEDLFFSRLARVRIEPLGKPSPRLYVMENGKPSYFGVLNSNTEIRLLNGTNRAIALDQYGSFFRVKNMANLRQGPGLQYQLYKINGQPLAPLQENNVVLVLRRMGDWSEIKLNRTESAWVYSPLLAAAFASNGNSTLGSPGDGTAQVCDVCHGDKMITKKVACSRCNGTKLMDCSVCNGKGNYLCRDCKGAKRFTCRDCKGAKILTCRECNGERKRKCRECKGKGTILTWQGLLRCTVCGGAGEFNCTMCGGQGYQGCPLCGQQGYLGCALCGQQGTFLCYQCSQTGKVTCEKCHGIGTEDAKYQCAKCDGTGLVLRTLQEINAVKGPSHQQMFVDNFSDNINRWCIGTYPDVDYFLSDGKYMITNRTSTYHFCYKQMVFSLAQDFTITTDTRHKSGVVDYGFGIMFGYSDNRNYYQFDMTSDGHYRVGKYTNGVFEALIPWTTSEVINSGIVQNRLIIKRSGSDCLFFVNSLYLNKIYNYRPSGEAIGFTVCGDQTIEFDDLKISYDSLQKDG